ncbi:Uu.00g121020.m01.CDS01 [Anthostomella pinea]|uniref:Uu.00g121020.m01.CDS01 n=1 Tax=Anthostomella pinea TaxID=933095 RepID=A0AAI8YEV3_9PEZI|nr:Uu.00g121020.m01.CDS01 [Anthostomella pinea]
MASPLLTFGIQDFQRSTPALAPKGKRENLTEFRFDAPSGNAVPNLTAQGDQARNAAEPLLQKCPDLMVARWREIAAPSVTELLYFMRFDIVARLAFGEPLGLL